MLKVDFSRESIIKYKKNIEVVARVHYKSNALGVCLVRHPKAATVLYILLLFQVRTFLFYIQYFIKMRTDS